MTLCKRKSYDVRNVNHTRRTESFITLVDTLFSYVSPQIALDSRVWQMFHKTRSQIIKFLWH